jgi:hypothetical protein
LKNRLIEIKFTRYMGVQRGGEHSLFLANFIVKGNIIFYRGHLEFQDDKEVE